MMEDGDGGPDSVAEPAEGTDASDGAADDADGATDEWPAEDAAIDGREGPRPPRETVDELSDEDLTDLDDVEGIEVEAPDTPIERGTIDRENALFVVLGVAISVLVFLEFLTVLPGG